jgi:hypothetical protein
MARGEEKAFSFCFNSCCCTCILLTIGGFCTFKGWSQREDEAELSSVEGAWDTTCTVSARGLLSKNFEITAVQGFSKKNYGKVNVEVAYCPVSIHYASDSKHAAGTAEAEVFAGAGESAERRDPKSWCASLLAKKTWPNIRIFERGHQQPPASVLDRDRSSWWCGDFGRLWCRTNLVQSGSRTSLCSGGRGTWEQRSNANMEIDFGETEPIQHHCAEPIQQETSGMACTVDSRGQIRLGSKAELEKQLNEHIEGYLASKPIGWFFFEHRRLLSLLVLQGCLT